MSMLWATWFLDNTFEVRETSHHYNNEMSSPSFPPPTKVYSYKGSIFKAIEVKGALKKNQVTTELEKKSSQIKSCLIQTSKVKFKISRNGQVVKDTIEAGRDNCIPKILQELKFPESRSSTQVTQTFGESSSEGYAGLQNHLCRARVMNWLVYAKIKIIKSLGHPYYEAILQSVGKVVCEYSQKFPINPGQSIIIKSSEGFKQNCAYLPLVRTWDVYDSNLAKHFSSLWVFKIAAKSFMVEDIYESPLFYKCN